jgi:SAM-dependent methyltransferase
MSSAVPTCEWVGFIVPEFSFEDYATGARVLDIGFGRGDQMRQLQRRGCHPIGIEFNLRRAAQASAQGLAVCCGQAESLPLASGSVDGVLCKVVIPYTDEARAVGEIARVLRPGGVARVSYHGLGYSLKYLLTDPNWKHRVYAGRVIVNTMIYRATGRRLPGFWGDTICQTGSRLRRYYRRAGLELIDDPGSPRFAGAPVFIYHVVKKR